MSEKKQGFKGRGGGFGGSRKGGFDRGARPGGERRERSGGGDRPFRRREGRDFGDKKPYEPRGGRDFDRGGDRPFKPREGRSFGDKKPYRKREEGGFGGDRPYKKREGGFGDKKPYRSRDEGGGFGDKKPYRKREEGGFGGDRPYKKREGGFGDKKPYRSRDEGGGFGDKKPYRKREEGGFGGDRPYKKREGGFGDKKPYRSRDEGRGFGDKKPYRKREEGGFGGDRPYKKREDWKDRAPRREGFEERPPRRDNRPGKLEMPGERPNLGSPSPLFLYGVHAVAAAWLNPARKITRFLATDSGLRALEETMKKAEVRELKRPPVRLVEREDIERLLPRDAVHQGLLLDCEPLEEVFLQDVLISAGDDAVVLVLDQVTDPHNIGAIMRSGAAFGAAAVVVQKIHAPDITGTLAKSASGAVEHIPLVREVNLSRAIEQLKEAGFHCVGLDERGGQTMSQAGLKGRKVGLVLGAEGDGIRKLVAETCDELVRLPTQGEIASLNVSNAAAVSLYELRR